MSRFLALLLSVPLMLSTVTGQSGQLAKGSFAPDFDVRSLQGSHLTLSGLRGKVVVLNFWFIACPPCRVEIPRLNRLVEDFAGKEAVFIAFSPDSRDDLRLFLEEMRFDYQIIPDSTPVAKAYGVKGAPTHMVIDKEGRLATVRYGAIEDPQKELGETIRRLLEAAGQR